MPTTVNIDSKGYGKIYKSVMRNKTLPLLAKAIYAYFCGYAGNGYRAFPKRDKIVQDLRINKDTFTKHLRSLVNEGYIAKERTSNGNIYTIVQTVPGYDNTHEEHGSEMTDRLVTENIAAKGYGTVPKLVMLDKELTAQAKAIYAYFASFTGAGTTAFPRRSTVMRELGIGSVNTYYQHLELLVERGYLSIEQRKTDGRFDVCTYRLNNSIESNKVSTRRECSMSEKVIHEENGNGSRKNDSSGEVCVAMSEEPIHGEELLKTSPIASEKTMSEKVRYEKSVPQFFGYANINNISTKNSYFIREQKNNHQPHPRLESTKLLPLFSSEEVKQHIGFKHLQETVDSWGAMQKNILGNFGSASDESRYYQTMDEVLMELVLQITNKLNKSTNAEQLLSKMDKSSLVFMLDEILSRWDDIRCVRAYVTVSLKNLLAHSDLECL